MAWIVRLPPTPATLKPADRCAIEREPPSAPAGISPTKAEAVSVKCAVQRGEHVAYSDPLSPNHPSMRFGEYVTTIGSGGLSGPAHPRRSGPRQLREIWLTYRERKPKRPLAAH
jgi:hypothetical protein